MGQQWKRFLKCIYLLKVMARKSPRPKLWPFPLYFDPILGEIMCFLRHHFPLEFRTYLYVFGNRRSKGMGIDRELINPRILVFLCHPTGQGPNYGGKQVVDYLKEVKLR